MIVLECSGKPARDLPTAENRAGHAVAIGRVLIGDEIALPGSVPDRIGADTPEIRVAAEKQAIPEDDHTAGAALDAIEHLDVNRIKSILHGSPIREVYTIRQTLNQNSQSDAMMFLIRQAWHNPAAGAASKSRGTLGSMTHLAQRCGCLFLLRRRVSLSSNILSALEVYDERAI
jgi:hypothetical protein